MQCLFLKCLEKPFKITFNHKSKVSAQNNSAENRKKVTILATFCCFFQVFATLNETRKSFVLVSFDYLGNAQGKIRTNVSQISY